MGALKVWDGTAWQTVSQQGPAGTAPVTSVDARTGAVTLSDIYVNTTGDTMTGTLDMSKLEIKQLCTERLASDPVSPQVSQRYYNGPLKRERYWNGTQWVDDKNLFIQQNRAATYALDAAGLVWIYFPVAFRVRDSVAVAVYNATDVDATVSVINANIEAGWFLVRVWNSAGVPYASSSFAIGYIAVGERP